MAENIDGRELYGRGLANPIRLAPGGRLARSNGTERLWESIEEILRTAKHELPLNPEFGRTIEEFDPIDSPEAVAWQIGLAIQRAEPRIDELWLAVRPSADPDTVEVSIRMRPVGQSTSENRVFPLYRKVST